MTNLSSKYAHTLLGAFATSSSGDDFCKQLVHKVLSSYGAIGALIGSVSNEPICQKIGSYGNWILSSSEAFELWAESPIASAIRESNPIVTDTAGQFLEEFPNAEVSLHGAESYLFVPFTSLPTAVGLLALGFSKPRTISSIPREEIELAVLAAEYFSLSARRSVIHGVRENKTFTPPPPPQILRYN